MPIALLATIALGCEQLANSEPSFVGKPGTTVDPIGELQRSTSRQSAVYLRGRAISTAPFAQGGAYLVRDRTGEIWVIAEQNLPNPGDEVAIAGQVEYRSIAIEGQEFGELYVRELEQFKPKK